MAQHADGDMVHVVTKRSGQPKVYHSDPDCVRLKDGTNTRPVPLESLHPNAKACDYCHDTNGGATP